MKQEAFIVINPKRDKCDKAGATGLLYPSLPLYHQQVPGSSVFVYPTADSDNSYPHSVRRRRSRGCRGRRSAPGPRLHPTA